jgi:hypothetical protein
MRTGRCRTQAATAQRHSHSYRCGSAAPPCPGSPGWQTWPGQLQPGSARAGRARASCCAAGAMLIQRLLLLLAVTAAICACCCCCCCSCLGLLLLPAAAGLLRPAGRERAGGAACACRVGGTHAVSDQRTAAAASSAVLLQAPAAGGLVRCCLPRAACERVRLFASLAACARADRGESEGWRIWARADVNQCCTLVVLVPLPARSGAHWQEAGLTRSRARSVPLLQTATTPHYALHDVNTSHSQPTTPPTFKQQPQHHLNQARRSRAVP